MQSQNIHKR